MSVQPVVEAVGTALPEHEVRQRELRELADELIPEGAPDRAQMLEVFDNTGIETRALAKPVPWYLAAHGHRERSQAFQEVGLALCEAAARDTLERAGRVPSEVGAVMVVTTTGIATPSLEARLVNRMDLPQDVARMPLWGLGCAGGVAGLNRAAEVARARPGRPVLLLNLELCSLSFSLDRALPKAEGEVLDLDKKTMVAATLFGDGCSGTLVSTDGDGPRHVGGASHLFPATERVMGWDVEDDTFDVVLSPRIPEITADGLSGIVHPFLDEHLGSGHEVDHWVLHPGGTRVLTAYAKALGLSEQQLALSRGVLADHGNMSSPTVIFALQRALDDGAPGPGETALLAALGPGFAADLALLRGPA